MGGGKKKTRAEPVGVARQAGRADRRTYFVPVYNMYITTYFRPRARSLAQHREITRVAGKRVGEKKNSGLAGRTRAGSGFRRVGPGCGMCGPRFAS